MTAPASGGAPPSAPPPPENEPKKGPPKDAKEPDSPGDTKYNDDKSVAENYGYKEGDTKGQETYQNEIDKDLKHGPDGKEVEPGDKKDRVDSEGNVYSYDPDANGGKGAYGVSGKISEEDMEKYKKGEDISDNIKWYDDDGYAKASGDMDYDGDDDPDTI
jgi:hypothetical protein